MYKIVIVDVKNLSIDVPADAKEFDTRKAAYEDAVARATDEAKLMGGDVAVVCAPTYFRAYVCKDEKSKEILVEFAVVEDIV